MKTRKGEGHIPHTNSSLSLILTALLRQPKRQKSFFLYVLFALNIYIYIYVCMYVYIYCYDCFLFHHMQ